jgi:hypothetical protein
MRLLGSIDESADVGVGGNVPADGHVMKTSSAERDLRRHSRRPCGPAS